MLVSESIFRKNDLLPPKKIRFLLQIKKDFLSLHQQTEKQTFMGTSKLSNENFIIRHLNHDTAIVEYKTTHHTCRSLIENDGSEKIISFLIDENKTSYLRRLLNLMKDQELIDEFFLKKYNLYVDFE